MLVACVHFFHPSEVTYEKHARELVPERTKRQEQRHGQKSDKVHGLSGNRDAMVRQKRLQGLSIESLLRLKFSKPSQFDPSDPRVKMAEEFFLKGKELNPLNSALIFDMAKLYESTSRREEAVRLYEAVILNRGMASAFDVINAYERSGLAFLAMGEMKPPGHERDQLTRRAEDMFMMAMALCGEAVVHLPQVGVQRNKLWRSYSSLLSILQQSEGTSKPSPQRREELTEFLENYIQETEAYKTLVKIVGTEDSEINLTNAGTLLETLKKYLRLVQVRSCVCAAPV
jgi:tetratricopeptide (TPR) repeat protein